MMSPLLKGATIYALGFPPLRGPAAAGLVWLRCSIEKRVEGRATLAHGLHHSRKFRQEPRLNHRPHLIRDHITLMHASIVTEHRTNHLINTP